MNERQIDCRDQSASPSSVSAHCQYWKFSVRTSLRTPLTEHGLLPSPMVLTEAAGSFSNDFSILKWQVKPRGRPVLFASWMCSPPWRTVFVSTSKYESTSLPCKASSLEWLFWAAKKRDFAQELLLHKCLSVWMSVQRMSNQLYGAIQWPSWRILRDIGAHL
jgi:hypothetical protein